VAVGALAAQLASVLRRALQEKSKGREEREGRQMGWLIA
jgi:hypothetical protein